MHKFTLYERLPSGEISRVRQINTEDVSDFTAKETLLGWPESVVYWGPERVDGGAWGLAPVSVSGRNALDLI